MKCRVVLLGDTILDNANYLNQGESDVTQQLTEILKKEDPQSHVTLHAVDGYSTSDVLEEAEDIQQFSEATHFVLSVGGVDAISKREEMWSAGEDSLSTLTSIQSHFEYKYNKLLSVLMAINKKIIIVLPYYPQFSGQMKRMAMFAMALFNDVILRQSFLLGLPVIDLRLTFTEDRDYASPIEPSMYGGLKLSQLIAKVIKEFDFETKKTCIFFDGTHYENKEKGNLSPILKSLNRLKSEVSEKKKKFMELENSLPSVMGGKNSEKDMDNLKKEAKNLDRWLSATIASRIWTSKNATEEETAAEKALRSEILQLRAWIFQY